MGAFPLYGLAALFKVTMGNNQAGSVGVFFTATIDEAIRIHGVPVQRQLTSSINVVYVFSNLTIF